ncbi:MAG TPA: hypothetical protein VFQ74_01385 [Pseudolysinimonas sp.]|nr:hypothetical protein [Pseudolysinimonas sp.]
MEQLIYAGVIGAFIGLILHYVLPGRHLTGLFLLPAIGGATTCVGWSASVWAGLKLDGGWIWLVSLGAAAVVSLLVGLLLPRGRKIADEQRLHRLSGGRA